MYNTIGLNISNYSTPFNNYVHVLLFSLLETMSKSESVSTMFCHFLDCFVKLVYPSWTFVLPLLTVLIVMTEGEKGGIGEALEGGSVEEEWRDGENPTLRRSM